LPSIDSILEQIRERAYQQAEDGACREPLPASPWEFALQCCITFDEASAIPGATEKVERPFPAWPFLQDVMGASEAEPYLALEKSGQLLVSWVELIYLLHRVLCNRGYRVAYYCQTATKAVEHLESRVLRLYQSIPAKYAKPFARLNNGVFEVYHDGADKLPTAFIMPMAAEQRAYDAAADKMRSMTWTEAVLDEAPFYPNLSELINSLLPRTQRLKVLGTVNGRTHMTVLMFGDAKNPNADLMPFEGLQKEELRRGVWKWQRNRFACMRVHYSAHPERDPDTEQGRQWKEAMAQRMDTRKWQREQECNSDVEAGNPVFCDTERIKVGRVCYAPWLPLLSGLDYSFLANVCVTGQIRKVEGKRYKLCITSETFASECFIKPFRDRVLAERASNYPGHTAGFTDYGDYAANQRTSTGVLIEEIRPLNLITVPTGPGGVRKRIELVQRLISQGLLEIDSSCIGLIRALKVGYVWDETKRDSTGAPVPSDKHPACDWADAAGYLCCNVFELQELPEGGNTVIVKQQYRGEAMRDVPRYTPGTVTIEQHGELRHQIWDAFRGSGL